MYIKISTDYRVDLHCHIINSFDENRLSPISSQLDHFVNRVPAEIVTKFIDGGTITRSKLQYKISNNKDKNISVETEYFPIAAKVCSYLQSNGVDYEIELSHKLAFYQENADDFAEIYLKTEPNAMVCKKTYGIEDDDSIMNSNYVAFQFKFNTSFFQTNEVSEKMIIDALQSCDICYSDNSSYAHIQVSKSDISSIKFTKYGLNIILEWLEWYRDILNTSYGDLEEKLEDLDLIQDFY